MAPTKKKRRSKHRGTAAGAIESRGRTGRPPSADERKKESRAQATERRLNTPPSWSTSAKRAGLAATLMFLFILLTTHTNNRVLTAAVFAIFSLVLYVPAGYYLELLLYRRRMRRKAVRK